MKILFDKLSNKCSKITTQYYSTSFSLGIYFLGNPLRNPIYSIYGFVRLADEIVDSFHHYPQSYLLQKFKTDTYEAIEYKISLNPILNSFQKVVHQYNISLDLINRFLESMAMDLDKIKYTEKNFNQYILGSAEVVGLMCLKVFTNGNTYQFDELKHYSMKLGAAFQKVNFLRDLKTDYQNLGRSYFPNVNVNQFSEKDKMEIETEIENDFKTALIGIKKLPYSSRGGVYLAYVYYYTLFKKIKNTPAHKVLTKRIRISNGHKLGLMVNSLVQHKMNLV